MNRDAVKKLLGTRNLERVRGMKMAVKYVKALCSGNAGRMEIKSSKVRVTHVLDLEGKHVFFGYYDLAQLDAAGRKLLVHIVDKNASPREDQAVIAWYDLVEKKVHPIAETRAWSWQQGARLRWLPGGETVMFNNVEDGRYVAQVWDAKNAVKVRSIGFPLYDVNPEMRFGIGVNFARLQRLRPGYGYSALPDATRDDPAPRNDGIFRVDLDTGGTELLVSYERLCELESGDKGDHHYVNHVSFSPDGKRFMFFHLWTKGASMRWSMRLYVADVLSGDLKCLEERETISHYCWRDNDTLLATKVNRDGAPTAYILYDVKTGEKRAVGSGLTANDGHPTFTLNKDVFLSDTYPQPDSLQSLYLFDLRRNESELLLRAYHDPRMYEEKRCDLHPRLTQDNKVIAFDTTFRKNRRSVVVLATRMEENP